MRLVEIEQGETIGIVKARLHAQPVPYASALTTAQRTTPRMPPRSRQLGLAEID